MPVDFHPLADDEANEAYEWLAARSQAAADRFDEELDSTLREIGRAPESFAAAEVPGYRSAPMLRAGYAVKYHEEAGRVVVIAVAHARRRPGYWAGRA